MLHTREKVLVKRAQKDPKYFGKLYEEYSDKIYRYIKRKVSNDEIAEDLSSLVFERALMNIASFQWQGVSVGSWLYKIARNCVYDYYRSARRRKTTNGFEEREEVEGDSDTPEEVMIHDEKELELYGVIAKLEEKDQYLLYFKYFEGMSMKEISDEVDLTEENVATRLHRIRKRLKSFLEDAEEYL